MEVDAPDVAGLYRRFAEIEARGSSPVYERLCLAVADDEAVIELLAGLPPGKRQPNLFLGALRLLGADVGEPTAALGFAVERWERLRAVMLARSTQTNEAARCALLLPALATVPGPLALVEIGASAGLCLRYESYGYEYRWADGQRRVGSGRVTLRCSAAGAVPVPERMPAIAARVGLDPSPLDPGDPEVARWLRSLVWPEHTERASRLQDTLALAASAPEAVLQGFAPDELGRAVAWVRERAPEATVVVVHSATVAYLTRDERARVAEACATHRARRIGLEGVEPTRDLGVRTPDRELAGRFVLSIDNAAVADADPHGRDLRWW